jgi:hypothetical protein
VYAHEYAQGDFNFFSGGDGEDSTEGATDEVNSSLRVTKISGQIGRGRAKGMALGNFPNTPHKTPTSVLEGELGGDKIPNVSL